MISVQGLGHRYRSGQEALRDVTFALEAGEFVGLLGPNGSGKSTLLRAMAGLPAVQGSVQWDGQVLSTLPRRMLAQAIALVSQSGTFAFPFKVEEIVMMGRFARLDRFGLQEAEQTPVVERCLEWTRLKGLRDRRVSELSGGEAQRVRLAQALAQEPKLLLLDEPTAHLDLSLQLEVLELLTRLNREQGVTVLLALHDFNLAARFCRRLLVLEGGRLVMDGPADEVLTSPRCQEVFRVRLGRWQANDGTTGIYPLGPLNGIQPNIDA